MFEVKGKRMRGLQKKTLKMQVVKESVGLEKEGGEWELAVRVG